jgi:uncharacterized protein YjiS (DUF1127 family)
MSTATSTPAPSSHEIHRRARHGRNLLIQALARHLARQAWHGLDLFARKCRRLVLRLANEWYCRRAIRALRQLDDRMLGYIGLSRSDIDWVVRCGAPWQRRGSANRATRSKRQPA